MQVDFFYVDNLDSIEKFVFADSKEKNKKNSGTEKIKTCPWTILSWWGKFESADNSGL